MFIGYDDFSEKANKAIGTKSTSVVGYIPVRGYELASLLDDVRPEIRDCEDAVKAISAFERLKCDVCHILYGYFDKSEKEVK